MAIPSSVSLLYPASKVWSARMITGGQKNEAVYGSQRRMLIVLLNVDTSKILSVQKMLFIWLFDIRLLELYNLGDEGLWDKAGTVACGRSTAYLCSCLSRFTCT
jgi:hypothetical protein